MTSAENRRIGWCEEKTHIFDVRSVMSEKQFRPVSSPIKQAYPSNMEG